MLIYLASEYNQDRLNFLKEEYIMNTEVKARLNQDAFMKCVKKELRNLEISCLIIDLRIFDQEAAIDFRQAIEAFSLLNPDCRIIAMCGEEGGMPELISSIYQCPDIYVIDSNVSNTEIIDVINGVDIKQNTVSDAAADNLQDMNEKADDMAVEGPFKEHDGLEEISPDEAGRISPPRELPKHETLPEREVLRGQEILPPDNIYDKAAAPVKLSEGKPLRKRVNKTPEEKAGDRPETMKLSTRVRRVQKYGDILSAQASDDEDWSCSNIMIGMVGTERRTGTTTAALHLARYLKEQGAAVIYTEANLHGHLEKIASGNNLTRVDDHFIYNNILYYMNSQFDQNAGANFIIFDMGCMGENRQRTEKILQEIMNEVIIVSGCKPYEIDALDKALSTLKNKDSNILFNLASPEETERLQKVYGSCARYVAAAPFEADLTLPGYWPDDFLKLFLPYRSKHQAVS